MGIKFENLRHDYSGAKKHEKVVAIKDINLNIEETNEFISLCGKTGSGKSTLAQHLNGLLLPTKGSINIFGNILTSKKTKNPPLKPIRKKIGFVFQFPEYQLFEETVRKDISFAPKIFGFDEEKIKEEVMNVAKLLKIEHLLDKSPFKLSGGQMRKVAIAGILAYKPDILVLDEPTRGLDPKASLEIMQIFNYINKKLGKTIILISHDMNIVYEYSTKIVVLKDSQIVYNGNKEKLFKTGEYKDYHLEKPEVLKLIDKINEKMNYRIDYDNFNLDDLLSKLKEVAK